MLTEEEEKEQGNSQMLFPCVRRIRSMGDSRHNIREEAEQMHHAQADIVLPQSACDVKENSRIREWSLLDFPKQTS